MKKQIKITEVGPRDGLQNEKVTIPTKDKFEFIQLLLQSGIKNIEVTSFVRPDRIPALSDSLELSEKLNIPSNPTFSCLVPNKKGLENAIKSGYKEIAIFGAASESFTKKNINMTIEESINSFKEVIKIALENKIKVRGYVSTVFYCPYEGKISVFKAKEISDRLKDLGVYEISLGDTIGKAIPADVDSLLSIMLKTYRSDELAMHFHNTYGTAIANVQKSLEFGLTSFDSSAGGLGGCPYAPGASGNLATEDLIYLLENTGYETGVDLGKLATASAYIENILGRKLNSNVYRAICK